MAFFPNVFGSYDTRDLPNLTLATTGVSQDAIMRDIQRWRDFYNEAVTLYEGVFARRVPDAAGIFDASGGGGGEMQPYVEYGATEATRTQELSWGWGAPIRRYRDRQMYTEEYLASNNLAQLNKDIVYATMRNYTTRLKMQIKALTRNTTYTWQDTTVFPMSNRGALTIYPLFNADARPGSMFVNGALVNIGTLQSYVPSGSATINIAHFRLARTKLRERNLLGHVVHVISPTDVDTVKAISPQFVLRTLPNPYIQVDNANTPVTTAVVTAPQSIGVLNDAGQGDGEVMVFPFWPAGYTFSYDSTQDVPLVIRERPEAQFRGFRLVQDQTRAAYGEQSLLNKVWEYIAGAAVENQSNGVVVQATTGAYVAPTV